MRNTTTQLSPAWNVHYARPRSGKVRTQAANAEGARKHYERYVTLARAKALAGDQIEAENYYQHAEHYLRSMSADSY
jgi:hypothetical protein